MHIKESFEKQKEIIKQLRDKEKVLQAVLEESHRSEEKEKRKIHEENRIAETMRDLKDNNRELRSQNTELKEKLEKMQHELQKKAVYIKSHIKDVEENRVRVQKKEEVEITLLKEQYKKVSDELKKVKDELQKLRKKRDKEVSELKNEIDRLKNEKLITQKSLESIIRALIDTLRKVYGRVVRLVRKNKGKEFEDMHKLFESSEGVHINALKIDEAFEEALLALDQICV